MKIINDDSRAIGCKNAEHSAVKLLTEERIRMLRMLSEKQMYPAEIARAMGMPIQAIYYHIRLLEKAGFLEFSEYGERNGGVAKIYRASSDSFAVIINNDGWKPTSMEKRRVPAFLEPFVENGFFKGRLVVGSPEPHGEYKARASEFGILELAMFMGQFATFKFPLYSLDTQMRQEDKKLDLIVAGGPKVNTFVAEINGLLPIRFDRKNFEIFSKLTKKRYLGNIGTVQLVENPFNKKARILLVSGLNQHGTRAAVLAMIEKTAEIEGGNEEKRGITAKVVEGFDGNGDGIVDSVEVLE